MKVWSKTLPTLALSTGEAELGVVVKGTAEAEGVQSILRVFRLDSDMVLRADATAAIGIVRRRGLDKIRHLSVGDLWVQQRVQSRALQVEKIGGRDNSADLMTKSF